MGGLTVQLSIPDDSFLDSFDYLGGFDADSYGKTRLNLYMLKINANEFNYSLLAENLLEPVISFSVSREVQKEYANRPHALTKKATRHFVEHCRNTGELGELLLYAFLECQLNAPKILTKLELKTSTSLYVNGADGIHYLKLPNGDYQLIFGESKTIKDPTTAIREAFNSIYGFKNEVNRSGNKKSGISYEKSLISDNLIKETFSTDDIDFVKNLIYPKRDSEFRVDDAFGIFIGYEINIAQVDKRLPNGQFFEKLKKTILNEVNSKISLINNHIDEKNLSGHCFHIYILPFTDLDENRKKILEELTT